MKTEVLILGGGLGGVSACLAAARLGARVILVEELDWLGGQLTAQGVPPDEDPWVEHTSRSASYSAFRALIRQHYRDNRPLSAAARAQTYLNPGSGNVGTLCHEPRVAALVIDEMLAAYVARGLVTILKQHTVLGADCAADHVRTVTIHDRVGGRTIDIVPDYVVDATETGDFLELADIEHVLGAESAAETGELHALEHADPLDQQALTWCMALEYFPDEDHTITRPTAYHELKAQKLPFWPNEQFAWTVSDHVTHKPLRRALFVGSTDNEHLFDLWHARRIAYRRHFSEGHYPSDISLANWPQMDYWLRPVIGVSPEARDLALEEARQYSLSFLYWMQTEAPRHDGGQGYRGLRLRGDVLGTADGLAKQAYYREGRRIRAQFTVVEQHMGVLARPGASSAEAYFDSVGIGAYRIDLHPSTSRIRDTVDIDAYPFEIPLGALLPVRMRNVIPACKNIGTTRITNGAYRVHTVEWSIGEAVGALLAFCLRNGTTPHAVREQHDLLGQFQSLLGDQGVLLRWPHYGALTPLSRRGYRKVLSQ
ncbi:FAD-dependent oxidoreductase [Chelatococcus asaccharovorans]|uniref:FAD dependent oxidoreductase n=1 Tax=Chelatococcus asaccharovorans TaxID=28210 RepID=A0A2V3U7H9_9HYPH|nr:FAD-dependent oxidoreductase [Chelatococcus asaccharovorans]MBS7706034.1 FAD-dependent oxidoreductase [Chelatococcus asaccharovorans]PXW59057.1 FAD dependent oxidoreductase [Chelatococcus asaccharovorans]